MLVICPKTSIEFTAAGFNKFHINGEHPLFSADYETLLRVVESWRDGHLNVSERRVLFVALLNSTGLVEFKCPATPSDEVVQKHMEFLVATSSWKHDIGSRIPLAHVAINHSTRELKDIRVWLSNWNNTQREATTVAHMQSVRDKVEKSAQKIRKLMQADREDTELYAKHLAKWFLEASAAPVSLHEYWTELFLLRGLAVFNASITDLEEVIEHMEDHVPMNSSYAMAAYRHVKKIHTLAKGGILAALTSHSSGETYSIVHDKIEEDNIAIATADISEDEPVEKEFTSKVSYLVARAKWRLKINALAEAIAKEAVGEAGEAVGEGENYV